MINTPSGAIYNPDSDSTRLLRKLRYRIGEIVYKIITGKSIPKTVSSLDKAKQVREYINDFDEHLRKILESDNLRENENEELFYHEIVNRSLELLLTKLKMDYAGIWLITEEKFHPVHQAGINKALDHRVIYSQIQEAEEISTSSGKNFSIFPSEGKNGGVDAIFTFKSLNERTMGYLILDDINNKRELTNFEIEKICDLFYAKLDKLIIEYELSRVNIQNIEIRNKLEEVTKQARTDTLTSFLNRRVGDEIFAQRMADVARGDTSVTIALIDIDYFKQVNDTHGHVFGDEVIRRIAQVLNIGYTEDEKILHIRRSTDDFVRYGGEEFLCILNHTNIRQAGIFLNKIRKIIEGLVFYGKDGKTFNVTISAGITMIQKDDVDYKNQLPIDKRINIIVSRADSALYDAKSGGRNMVKAYVKK